MFIMYIIHLQLFIHIYTFIYVYTYYTPPFMYTHIIHLHLCIHILYTSIYVYTYYTPSFMYTHIIHLHLCIHILYTSIYVYTYYTPPFMYTHIIHLHVVCVSATNNCVLWQVLLFAERNKLSGLKRLLEAGGAQVFSSGAKYVLSSQ